MSIFDPLNQEPGKQIFAHIHVDVLHDTSLAQQVKQQITYLIAAGQLKAGDRLPPVRAMAKQLSINLHTVRSAYLKLEAEGLVETRRGRGTHVLPFDPRRIALVSSNLRSHTVGVIMPSWSNPFYHALLHGVEEVASETHTLIFVCTSHDDPATTWNHFARLAAKQVDGMLVFSDDLSDVMPPGAAFPGFGRPIPCGTVDWPGCPGYAVNCDLQGAAFQAVEHLLQHGHRRIGLITFILDSENVHLMNLGYQNALTQAGLPVDPVLTVRMHGFDMTAGAEGTRRLLTLENPPTAIFTIADMPAFGALEALKDAGLCVPQDVALASFNDVPLSGLVDPPLTTVAAPAFEMGKKAMSILEDLIAGREPQHAQVTLPTRLVVRQSCGCSPSSRIHVE